MNEDMKQYELNDDVLDNVNGGVKYTNFYEGSNGQTYKIGWVNGDYTHTFAKSDKTKIDSIIEGLADRTYGLNQDQTDAIIMEELIKSGLLTEIKK